LRPRYTGCASHAPVPEGSLAGVSRGAFLKSGPGDLGKPTKNWGTKPPTFWRAFPGPRGRPNLNKAPENSGQTAFRYPECGRTKIRSQTARAFGPDTLGTYLGPSAPALRPQSAPNGALTSPVWSHQILVGGTCEVLRFRTLGFHQMCGVMLYDVLRDDDTLCCCQCEHAHDT
jgi:hypothetical protein